MFFVVTYHDSYQGMPIDLICQDVRAYHSLRHLLENNKIRYTVGNGYSLLQKTEFDQQWEYWVNELYPKKEA